MQAGLDVFTMESPEHKELKDVERNLDLMEQVRLRVWLHAPFRRLTTETGIEFVCSLDHVHRITSKPATTSDPYFFYSAPHEKSERSRQDAGAVQVGIGSLRESSQP